MTDNNSIIPNFDDEWDKSLKITITDEPKLPGVLQVYLKGSIDNYNTSFFENKLNKILEHGTYKILFKCASLDYVSSSAIGVFANYYPKFTSLGGTFVFIDMSIKVLEIFQLLGFTHFFNIASDLDEASVFFNAPVKTTTQVFPKVIECPMCSSKLKTSKAGIFRCAKCKTILTISSNGKVSI